MSLATLVEKEIKVKMATSVVPGALSHTRRVCSLYKQALRILQAVYQETLVYRYQAVHFRHKMDQHVCEKDPTRIKELVDELDVWVFENQHYQPMKFTKSPGGVAFAREVVPPDWVLDYWHPLEKAAYPEYFARREERKKEFVKWWEKQYGKPEEGSSHH